MLSPQAVSDYLKGLVEEGYVETSGRGRYTVTNEGVDWLISQTDALRDLVEHVSTDVIGQVDVETAIATTPIDEGQLVSLTMGEGTLRATADDNGGATAVAVTDAEAGGDVGVTNSEGVLDYDLGTVTVVSIPPTREGGSDAADTAVLADLAASRDLVATAGIETLVAARRASIEPDARFGTPHAVREAATKGLDVLLIAVTSELSAHTDRLREANLGYEVVDAAEE
jgi:putative transcriptional regulator